MRSTVWVAGLLVAACSAGAAIAADYAGPARYHAGRRAHAYIGECVRTRVLAIGSPVAAPGQATAIVYRDGVVQEYDAGMLGHAETRPGDPIQLCLVSFSRDCGEADLPGRTYATGNLRTGAAWTLPDTRSSCQAR